MSKTIFFAVAFAALALAQGAKAQTNLQTFYDFGKGRDHFTTTLEGFYGDKWGNTFFFVDYDYNNRDNDDKVFSPNGTYFEIARCFNFWQDSSIGALSLQVEYNGGVYHNVNAVPNGYTINNAFLFGVDYFLHNSDFSNTFNFKVLYKNINYAGALNLDGKKRSSALPLQLTFVWGMQDIFGVKGLRFSGFADFWGESHTLYSDNKGDSMTPEDSDFVFISEPQLWYNIGQHFGVENLHIGTEVELSYDFGTCKGFWVRPCLGTKWVF